MTSFTKNNRNWYAIYTRSRAEKKVQAELELKGITCFLPLQKKQRQWKDRKKWIDAPLLPGYCFVNISRKDYDRVLQVQNVVCYITFEGKAAVVREEQIEGLKRLLRQNDFEVEITHENFEIGKKVEVVKGSLTGLTGELCETRGKYKFLMRIEQIGRFILVEIPAEYINAVPTQKILT